MSQLKSFRRSTSAIRILLFIVCILFFMSSGYGLFYQGWWQFIPSTLFILLTAWLCFPDDWKTYLGLKGSLREILTGICLCSFFAMGSYFIIRHSLPDAYTLIPGNYRDYLIPPFQSFNEEMVFRALLLTALTQTGLKKWLILVLPALVFSMAHWLFYSFNLHTGFRGDLDFSALATLLCFGISTNALFLATRSILLPWALHCGWNLNRFGSHIISMSSADETIPEYLTFNLLEGSESVLILSALTAGLCVLWWQRTGTYKAPRF
ncbi:MAG: CPBP family intramembrane metalloprotease [Deltaproteobacteria bacterium]|nr:CPBP family intramembrane metalloprotease [Deltaproteobacteria bacterium]